MFLSIQKLHVTWIILLFLSHPIIRSLFDFLQAVCQRLICCLSQCLIGTWLEITTMSQQEAWQSGYKTCINPTPGEFTLQNVLHCSWKILKLTQSGSNTLHLLKPTVSDNRSYIILHLQWLPSIQNCWFDKTSQGKGSLLHCVKESLPVIVYTWDIAICHL